LLAATIQNPENKPPPPNTANSAAWRGRGLCVKGRLEKTCCSGGHSGGETPGSLPNPVVKPASADGTPHAGARESRTPPEHTPTHTPTHNPSPLSSSLSSLSSLSFFSPFFLFCVCGAPPGRGPLSFLRGSPGSRPLEGPGHRHNTGHSGTRHAPPHRPQRNLPRRRHGGQTAAAPHTQTCRET
jgi:hypothetical protein